MAGWLPGRRRAKQASGNNSEAAVERWPGQLSTLRGNLFISYSHRDQAPSKISKVTVVAYSVHIGGQLVGANTARQYTSGSTQSSSAAPGTQEGHLASAMMTARQNVDL